MAPPVAGDPGVYSGELWLMSVGAYSIEAAPRGRVPGRRLAARIPVNSVATHQLPLPPFLAANLLLVLEASFLTFGSVAIVYAAAGESVLDPGAIMQPANRKKGLLAGAITAVVLALALFGGWHWWQAEEQTFHRKLRAGTWPDLTATVETAGPQRILHLVLGEKAFRPDYALPLLPDHGKPLHLFLIREPSLDSAFAHLHPVRHRRQKPSTSSCPMSPKGSTKSSAISRPAIPASVPPPPLRCALSRRSHRHPGPTAADVLSPRRSRRMIPSSWRPHCPPTATTSADTDTTVALPDGRQAIWKAHPPLHAQHDAHLEFLFRDAAGQPLPLEPYMGMLSHAAILRADGAIFAHLHPSGNYSMAAQSFFAAKIAHEISKSSGADTNANTEMDHSKMHRGSPDGPPPTSITLPYEFPTPGDYHIWVQIKTAGEVFTAAFETTVAP